MLCRGMLGGCDCFSKENNQHHIIMWMRRKGFHAISVFPLLQAPRETGICRLSDDIGSDVENLFKHRIYLSLCSNVII